LIYAISDKAINESPKNTINDFNYYVSGKSYDGSVLVQTNPDCNVVSDRTVKEGRYQPYKAWNKSNYWDVIDSVDSHAEWRNNATESNASDKELPIWLFPLGIDIAPDGNKSQKK
jgi:hypothetical protein